MWGATMAPLTETPAHYWAAVTPNNPYNRTTEHLHLGFLWLPHTASTYFHR